MPAVPLMKKPRTTILYKAAKEKARRQSEKENSK
jgi:hypothetical protein